MSKKINNRASPYRAALRLFFFLFSVSPVGISRSQALEVSKVGRCNKTESLTISVLNVGQGAATLIKCPDGHNFTIIDSGDSDERYPNASKLFYEAAVRRLSGKRINYALATHPHPDHISGFFTLFQLAREKKISIRKYLDNGSRLPDDSLALDLRKSALDLGIGYIDAVKSGLDSITICPASKADPEGIKLELYYPSDLERNEMQCEKNINDCSILSSLEHRGVKILLLADLLSTGEMNYLKRKTALGPTDVALVGHHGNDSCSESFLSQIKPKLAILSTGTPGLGSTSVVGFPEKSVVGRLINQLPPTPATLKIEEKQLPICVKTPHGCQWESVAAPVTLRSTAIDGEIELTIEEDSICMEVQNSSQKLEFKLQ